MQRRSRAVGWRLRLGLGGLVALAAFAGSFARAPAGVRAQARCAATPVHYELAPAGDARLGTLPWIATEPRSLGLVGHLFYYDAFPSVVWGKRRVGDLRLYSGGRSPDNRVNMKILWSAPSQLEGAQMMLRGQRLGTSETFVQRLHVGPSIIRVPRVGCWRLTLTAGKLVTRLTATVVRGSAQA